MLNVILSSFRPSKRLAESPEPTSGAFFIMASSQMANKQRTSADSAGGRRRAQKQTLFAHPITSLGVRAADLSHVPWHKAADPYAWTALVACIEIYRPDHRLPGL